MIGFLHGTVLEKQPHWLLLDVGGVGYEIQVPMTSFYQLPAFNTTVSLHTHFVVREDAQQLFGFADKASRDLFRDLVKVNGIGPKMALALLSALDAAELIASVQHRQTATLVRVPGIGQKTAERLIVELQGRLPQAPTGALDNTVPNHHATTTHDAQADAESALQALGYKPQEASRAVAAIVKTADTVPCTEDLIRLALQQMVSR